jgi:hypothetical protein
MRVVVWSSGYCRGFGGAENMANALVSRLDRLGVDTILVADGDPTRAPHVAYFSPLPERTEVYVDTFPNPLLWSRRPT